jgi:hypothetical protein
MRSRLPLDIANSIVQFLLTNGLIDLLNHNIKKGGVIEAKRKFPSIGTRTIKGYWRTAVENKQDSACGEYIILPNQAAASTTATAAATEAAAAATEAVVAAVAAAAAAQQQQWPATAQQQQRPVTAATAVTAVAPTTTTTATEAVVAVAAARQQQPATAGLATTIVAATAIAVLPATKRPFLQIVKSPTTSTPAKAPRLTTPTVLDVNSNTNTVFNDHNAAFAASAAAASAASASAAVASSVTAAAAAAASSAAASSDAAAAASSTNRPRMEDNGITLASFDLPTAEWDGLSLEKQQKLDQA